MEVLHQKVNCGCVCICVLVQSDSVDLKEVPQLFLLAHNLGNFRKK